MFHKLILTIFVNFCLFVNALMFIAVGQLMQIYLYHGSIIPMIVLRHFLVYHISQSMVLPGSRLLLYVRSSIIQETQQQGSSANLTSL